MFAGHILLVGSSSSTFSFVVSRHEGLATTNNGSAVDRHPSFLAIALRVVTVRNRAGELTHRVIKNKIKVNRTYIPLKNA